MASVDPLEQVASFNDIINVTLYDGISIPVWDAIQSVLQEGTPTPIWIDIYHEARRRLETGGVRGACLDIAVSAEAFIRRRLLDAIDVLPQDETAIRKRLESWGMTDVLNSLDKVSTLRELDLNSSDVAVLRRAFDARNSLMHGKAVELDEASLSSSLATVKKLVGA